MRVRASPAIEKVKMQQNQYQMKCWYWWRGTDLAKAPLKTQGRNWVCICFAGSEMSYSFWPDFEPEILSYSLYYCVTDYYVTKMKLCVCVLVFLSCIHVHVCVCLCGCTSVTFTERDGEKH